MKKYIASFALLFILSPVFSQQKVDQFCQVLITQKMLSTKVNISVDFGERRQFLEDTRMRDQADKLKSFNSTVDALNYMGKQGWKLVFVAPRTGSDVSSYYYTFKKEFDASELKKDEE